MSPEERMRAHAIVHGSVEYRNRRPFSAVAHAVASTGASWQYEGLAFKLKAGAAVFERMCAPGVAASDVLLRTAIGALIDPCIGDNVDDLIAADVLAADVERRGVTRLADWVAAAPTHLVASMATLLSIAMLHGRLDVDELISCEAACELCVREVDSRAHDGGAAVRTVSEAGDDGTPM
ncbi:hypothetical protein EON68_00950 [archaeon]|nr:MAG: hypothetical protein EON68_00950 [archaeon]